MVYVYQAISMYVDLGDTCIFLYFLDIFFVRVAKIQQHFIHTNPLTIE